MKKFSLILFVLVFFALTVYLAFVAGGLSFSGPSEVVGGVHLAAAPLGYMGYKAAVAKGFSVVLNSLLRLTGGSVLWAIILLGFLVELVLLYPSVTLQLKQKKIHLFHHKLVDRFASGELIPTETKEELYKLCDVNEKIHRRGAALVCLQILLFFLTLWGLSLTARQPGLIEGSWSVLNFSLLARPESALAPVAAGLFFLLHSVIKIYYKEKEDRISRAQIALAVSNALIGSAIVYFFTSVFPLALTLYCVTLAAFAAIRYVVVEQRSGQWMKLAHLDLIRMLREARPHTDRFEYFSRQWHHLPVIRHINFSLLEEALSMSLGLLLALSFFGAYEKPDSQMFQADISFIAIQMQSP